MHRLVDRGLNFKQVGAELAREQGRGAPYQRDTIKKVYRQFPPKVAFQNRSAEALGRVTTSDPVRANGFGAQIRVEAILAEVGLSPAELDFAAADDKTKMWLIDELHDLDLSVRAKNICIIGGLKTVADLVQCTEPYLWRIPNCGRKTVHELKTFLLSRGLRLNTQLRNFDPRGATLPKDQQSVGSEETAATEIETAATEIDFATLEEGTQAWLIEELPELDFSARAQNIFIALGLRTVADLVQCTESDLHRAWSCGRKTIAEIEKFLSARGLTLNTTLRNFDPRAGEQLRAILREGNQSASQKQKQGSVSHALNTAKSLEEELLIVLAIEASDRDVQLAAKLWGWFGKRPRTLESVGQEYGLTRERVRQIAERIARKIRKRKLVTPILLKSAQLIRSSCPATPQELIARLKEANLSAVGVHPEGVAKACELLEIPLGLETAAFAGNAICLIEDMEGWLATFQREARRRTQANGCVNFNALCEELRISDAVARRLHSLLSTNTEFEWLDTSQIWFCSRKPTRNRLLNLVSKVLATCPRLRLNELRMAVGRSRRLEVKPPIEVLEHLVQVAGLGTIEDGFVIANPEAVQRPEPGSIEEIFVQILRDNGPALTGREFEELCIRKGMNATSFYLYRSGSPIVSQLAPGVFSLVGATPPPGLIEELASKSRSSQRLVEHGWGAQGCLWCAVSLSRAVITTGSIALPSFVANLVQGEWNILLPDGSEAGTAECKGTFLKGLRKALSYMGTEPGDLILFEFDLHSRVMKTRIGGPELLELAESGNLHQLPEV